MLDGNFSAPAAGSMSIRRLGTLPSVFPSRILLEKVPWMRVRLVRKLADWLDGIDLSRFTAGDVIDLADLQARIVIAEGWAVFARREADMVPVGSDASVSSFAQGRRLFGDRRRSSRLNDLYQRLRDKHEQIDQERRRFRRRATDAGTPHAA